MNKTDHLSTGSSDDQSSTKQNPNTLEEAGQSGFRNLPQQRFYPESDRRQTQRRQNDRSGKYDRRRNRCALCHHFAAPANESEPLGTCTAHNTPMAAAAFACPVFESNP